MRFEVAGRTIRQYGSVLGMQGDNRVETVEFVLDRWYGDVDLSQGIAYILFSAGDTAGYVPDVEKTVEEDKLVITWLVGSQATATPGTLHAAIKISGLDGQLWSSEITVFQVGKTILADSPQPVSLQSRTARIARPELEPPITVTERRLNVPAVLKNIAVQNDQNSETVRIKCPRFFDGNDLAQYSFVLRTLNSQGGYDPVALMPKAAGDEIQLDWVLRPPQTSYNGQLSIQLQVTGADFDWQTEETAVNILRQIEGEPVIPTEPGFLDDFLKQVAQLASQARESEESAAGAAQWAAQSQEQARQSAQEAKGSAQEAKGNAQAAAGSAAAAQEARAQAQRAAASAQASGQAAKGYRDEAAAFAEASRGSAQAALDGAQDALEAALRAREEADRSQEQAGLSEGSALRAEDAADRARRVADLYFENPHTGQTELLQGILNENFNFLFGLIRKLHQLGLSWAQINQRGLSWSQINRLQLSWREIAVAGITAQKIADLRQLLMGR